MTGDGMSALSSLVTVCYKVFLSEKVGKNILIMIEVVDTVYSLPSYGDVIKDQPVHQAVLHHEWVRVETVELLHYCSLLGRELQSSEIFS